MTGLGLLLLLLLLLGGGGTTRATCISDEFIQKE